MTSARSITILNRLGRFWPEAVLAVLASVAFFGSLGALEIWSHGEQRAMAAAIDTLDHQHWLAAELGGQPRWNEPPLSRLVLAGLMAVTGERAEWVVRIPGAVSGVAVVALVYLLGRRLGGRSVGLASALVLTSMGYFVTELRQAGNAGPLVLFTALTIYAAQRRMEEDPAQGHRHGLSLFYVSLGLGFLTGGPRFLVATVVMLLGALATARRVRWGVERLWDVRGLILFAVIVLGWPAAVFMGEPGSGRLWLSGLWATAAGIHFVTWFDLTHFAGLWPRLLLPWAPIALVAVFHPFMPKRPGREAGIGDGEIVPSRMFFWLVWWWGMGSVVVLCPWVSSNALDLVPCLPGMSILIGDLWVRLARSARDRTAEVVPARFLLQIQWVLLFFVAGVLPLFSRAWMPEPLWAWSLVISGSVATSTVMSAIAWRRGADALALAPITMALVVSLWIVYGVAAPSQNSVRSHRTLAQTMQRIIPENVHTVLALDDVDEGVRCYLRGLDLAPLSGTEPGPGVTAIDARTPGDRLIAWLEKGHPGSSFVLLRNSVYSRVAAQLGRRVTPIVREAGLARDELVLLEVHDPLKTQTAVSDGPVRR